MKNTNSIWAAPTKMVAQAITTTKDVAQRANGFALKATEEFVTESLQVTEQWQGVTNKAIKGGLKLAAAQQNLVFNALTGFKNNYKVGRKRFEKLVS